MRKIPATMVSQHPDHARAPYWHDSDAFISTRNEAKECYLSFSELGVSEYKWDWEGKLVDESIIERLIGDHYKYFKENELGLKKFLTFRLPNPQVETEFRLGRAFMGILSASILAKQFKLHSPPLFEVILPMTHASEDMMAIQAAFLELASLKHPLFKFNGDTFKELEVIPLFEEVNTQINSVDILAEYIRLHQKQFGDSPKYIRPYLARSDPALNSGLIPTVLAIKIALSRYKKFETNKGIKLYPIIGSASLPFRGGLTPNLVLDFVKEYSGIRTALLQSAFRYDFDKEEVKKAILALEKNIPKGGMREISKEEEKLLIKMIGQFEALYRPTIEKIASKINQVAEFMPKRRERVLHTGLFGYSRGVGKVKLPRAISFTGALYSLGVPPELIGTGRGIRKVREAGGVGEVGGIEVLEKHYLNIKKELTRAGGFLNKGILRKLASKDSAWREIEEDVEALEEYLGMELGPRTEDERNHLKATNKIFKKLEDGNLTSEDIVEGAIFRRSLG